MSNLPSFSTDANAARAFCTINGKLRSEPIRFGELAH
jgi:hypothetical protein